ncbi:MAG: hypothetical protein ACLT8A_02420 [Subdoligranulum sp.]
MRAIAKYDNAIKQQHYTVSRKNREAGVLLLFGKGNGEIGTKECENKNEEIGKIEEEEIKKIKE